MECIKTHTTKQITQLLKIPTIGIGSSVHCDGQVLVTDDLIGLNDTKQTYIKRSNSSLNFSKVASKITEIIKNEDIKLILGSSTYMCRDLISFISVDLNSSPISNVIDFDLHDGKISTVNSINGGESLYKAKINPDHSLLLIRPKAFDPAEVELNTDYETIDVDNSDIEDP